MPAPSAPVDQSPLVARPCPNRSCWLAPQNRSCCEAHRAALVSMPVHYSIPQSVNPNPCAVSQLRYLFSARVVTAPTGFAGPVDPRWQRPGQDSDTETNSGSQFAAGSVLPELRELALVVGQIQTSGAPLPRPCDDCYPR